MLRGIKAFAAARGIHVARSSSLPYGVDKFVDFAALAPNAEIAFDVGANVGQTVQQIRAACPAVRIVSFEPLPATFAALRANTRDVPNVACVEAALGAAPGEATMTADPLSGQNTLNTSARPDAPTVSVPVMTLDGYCADQGIDRIDLLKIDTEGYEMAVLRGAEQMLKRGAIRFVLAECEFIHNPSEPHGDFFAISGLLMPLGFRVVAFYSGGVDGNGWRWGDVLFMLPGGERSVTCSPYA
jgi:FkbM family methyltransferase